MIQELLRLDDLTVFSQSNLLDKLRLEYLLQLTLEIGPLFVGLAAHQVLLQHTLVILQTIEHKLLRLLALVDHICVHTAHELLILDPTLMRPCCHREFILCVGHHILRTSRVRLLNLAWVTPISR